MYTFHCLSVLLFYCCVTTEKAEEERLEDNHQNQEEAKGEKPTRQCMNVLSSNVKGLPLTVSSNCFTFTMKKKWSCNLQQKPRYTT